MLPLIKRNLIRYFVFKRLKKNNDNFSFMMKKSQLKNNLNKKFKLIYEIILRVIFTSKLL